MCRSVSHVSSPYLLLPLCYLTPGFVQECDWKYRLYAVLVHSGWSTASGHYYCYVQTSPGIWHCMNDSLVCTVECFGSVLSSFMALKGFTVFQLMTVVLKTTPIQDFGSVFSL